MSIRAKVLRRAGQFASKLGRREAGGAIMDRSPKVAKKQNSAFGRRGFIRVDTL